MRYDNNNIIIRLVQRKKYRNIYNIISDNRIVVYTHRTSLVITKDVIKV